MRCFGLVVSTLLLSACSCWAADTTGTDTTVWKPSPTGAAFRAFIFPGWGQSYNRKPLKAVLIGGIEQGLIFGVYREHQLFRDARRFGNDEAAGLYKEQRNRLAWLLAASVIYATVDAFVDAHLYDFDVSGDLGGNVKMGGVQISFALLIL